MKKILYPLLLVVLTACSPSHRQISLNYLNQCNQGNTTACHRYLYGNGRNLSYNEIFDMMKYICNNGGYYYNSSGGNKPDYCFLVADGYLNGVDKVKGSDKIKIEKNIPLAIEYFDKGCFAKNKREANSCLQLAEMYYQGKIVSKNFSKALKYAEQSCTRSFGTMQTQAKSCFMLGQMYEKGQGTKRNYAIAENYYRDACSMNSGDYCHYHKKFMARHGDETNVVRKGNIHRFLKNK